jgi:hypothetical protein
VSWFDSFDTYPTGQTNIYADYPRTVMTAPFRPTLNAASVTISPNGRRGGKSLVANLSTNSGYDIYLTRGIVGPTAGREPYVRIGMAVLMNGGGSLIGNFGQGQTLFSLRVAAQRRSSAFVTYYEVDGVIQAYIDGTNWSPAKVADNAQVDGLIDDILYRKDAFLIGIASDGFLRASVGSRGYFSGTGTEPVISRSTKQMPFDQWCHLEFSIFMGTPGESDGFIYGWMDGELVMQATDIYLGVEADYDNIFYRRRTTFESLLNGPRVASGSYLFNADNGGYIEFRLHPSGAGGTNLLDDLYVLHDPTIPGNVPLGDLVGINLPVTADGAFQNSTIGGTTPAATHWQSVETDDGDATRVEFDEFDEDAYVHDALDSGLTVKALRVIARAKKSDDGAGALALTATNTDGGLLADRQDVRSTTEYITISDTFERDPLGNEWTPATVNDAEIGIKRAL